MFMTRIIKCAVVFCLWRNSGIVTDKQTVLNDKIRFWHARWNYLSTCFTQAWVTIWELYVHSTSLWCIAWKWIFGKIWICYHVCSHSGIELYRNTQAMRNADAIKLDVCTIHEVEGGIHEHKLLVSTVSQVSASTVVQCTTVDKWHTTDCDTCYVCERQASTSSAVNNDAIWLRVVESFKGKMLLWIKMVVIWEIKLVIARMNDKSYWRLCLLHTL